jgi:hypothetical protein
MTYSKVIFPFLIVYVEHNEMPMVVLQKIAKAIFTLIKLVFNGLIERSLYIA